MPTSTPGTPDDRGFTLVELAVVLLVLGLIVWIAAPRLASLGGRDRDAVFRDLAAGSEAAFDLALFEKREVRLRIDPTAGTYAFLVAGRETEASQAREIGDGLAVSGVQVDGEERPPDVATEIHYRPGGRVPAVRIFFRETGRDRGGAEWTLTINPFDGSVDVLEGRRVARGRIPDRRDARRTAWTNTSS